MNDFDGTKIINREFVAAPRYGYGAIDEYATDINGNRVCLRNVFSGRWLTQKAARWIASELNRAYGDGALRKVCKDFDLCPLQRDGYVCYCREGKE